MKWWKRIWKRWFRYSPSREVANAANEGFRNGFREGMASSPVVIKWGDKIISISEEEFMNEFIDSNAHELFMKHPKRNAELQIRHEGLSE